MVKTLQSHGLLIQLKIYNENQEEKDGGKLMCLG